MGQFSISTPVDAIVLAFQNFFEHLLSNIDEGCAQQNQCHYYSDYYIYCLGLDVSACLSYEVK